MKKGKCCLPVEVDTDVRPHILRANTEHFVRLHSLGVGPLGDHVVQDSLHQVPRDLVQDHELPHPVQHLVVLGSGQGHVVDDGRHVPEDGGVEEGGDDHHAHREAFLAVRLRGNIAEANGGHTGHREVKCCHVHRAQAGARLDLSE